MLLRFGVGLIVVLGLCIFWPECGLYAQEPPIKKITITRYQLQDYYPGFAIKNFSDQRTKPVDTFLVYPNNSRILYRLTFNKGLAEEMASYLRWVLPGDTNAVAVEAELLHFDMIQSNIVGNAPLAMTLTLAYYVQSGYGRVLDHTVTTRLEDQTPYYRQSINDRYFQALINENIKNYAQLRKAALLTDSVLIASYRASPRTFSSIYPLTTDWKSVPHTELGLYYFNGQNTLALGLNFVHIPKDKMGWSRSGNFMFELLGFLPEYDIPPVQNITALYYGQFGITQHYRFSPWARFELGLGPILGVERFELYRTNNGVEKYGIFFLGAHFAQGFVFHSNNSGVHLGLHLIQRASTSSFYPKDMGYRLSAGFRL